MLNVNVAVFWDMMLCNTNVSEETCCLCQGRRIPSNLKMAVAGSSEMSV
jgi:hypothetical protein